MIRNQDNGLYNIFLQRLRDIKINKKIIPFPYVFEKLCTSFSIKKDDCFKVLIFLKDSGAIDVIFGHGVKLKEIEEFNIKEIVTSKADLNYSIKFQQEVKMAKKKSKDKKPEIEEEDFEEIEEKDEE